MSTQAKRNEQKYDLDKIKIASPCNMSWNDMKGDDRSRHCSACQLNVFNIAGLSKQEAQELLAKRAAGERVCVRLLRRQDGTIITKDCPVGVSLARRARLRLASLSASAMAMALWFTGFRAEATSSEPAPTIKRAFMGKIAAPQFAPGIDEIAGGISAPVEIEPEPEPQPEPALMGEIAPEGHIEPEYD